MDLSIIIPTYNEAAKIAQDLGAAAHFLAASGLRGEIIVSDDGSSDGTPQIVREMANSSEPGVKLAGDGTHRGKGAAVRAGMLASSGAAVLFADAGGNVPFAEANRGLGLLKEDACDIAHGSRRLPESNIRVPQPLHRRFISATFGTLARIALPLPSHLTDTQCGFKLYRGDVARKLYAECRLDGFLFDLEIILLARRNGHRILEFPIDWTCDPDTRIDPKRHSKSVLSELISLRNDYRTGRFAPAVNPKSTSQN